MILYLVWITPFAKEMYYSVFLTSLIQPFSSLHVKKLFPELNGVGPHLVRV